MLSEVARWLEHWSAGISRSLTQFVTGEVKFQIWKTCDRSGRPHWHTYDRLTDRSTSLSSEAEVRFWLEQRHYD